MHKHQSGFCMGYPQPQHGFFSHKPTISHFNSKPHIHSTYLQQIYIFTIIMTKNDFHSNTGLILLTCYSNQQWHLLIAPLTEFGSCMTHEYDGVKHPVMYASKKLPCEQNYSVGETHWQLCKLIPIRSAFHSWDWSQPLFADVPLKNPTIMRWSLSLQSDHCSLYNDY